MDLSPARFIKTGLPFVRAYDAKSSPAPMFRKTFTLGTFSSARLFVCALGLGCVYINGRRVSDDLFTAPASDYLKTLWVNTYDVTRLLRPGENVIAALLGNGWYNEPFKTPWNHNEAPWRDNPKIIAKLTIDGKAALVTDSTWLCTDKSPVVFNHLRSGETFDFRLYDERWAGLPFDDSSWERALIDPNPPTGAFREYLCQPVRECAVYPAKKLYVTDSGRAIYDIGQNISGYVRLRVKQNAGDELTIRYAEQLNGDLTLQLNGMERFYPESPFQTDRVILANGEVVWSPMFTYHGFRYIEITGLENPDLSMVSGVFAHLDAKLTSDFACSDGFLNKLFQLGRMAVYSNLQHILTDCPTREKLGWANDAQASAEQILINFDSADFFKKWLVDIVDSTREDGAIPGIIPTGGWGYEWGAGPVSSGVLFEIPYRIYLLTGDAKPLCDCLPAFMKHLDYIKSRAGEDGLISYGLSDWAGPFEHLDRPPTPVKFTDSLLYIKCLKIAALSAKLSDGKKAKDALDAETARMTDLFKREYLRADGSCKVDEQTAVALLIVHNVHNGIDSLREQLKKAVEAHGFHHNCGMVGLRHLYDALSLCGLDEYAYRIITASGFPSYRDWVDGDATTLWESWQRGNSKNHHMYSSFMAWLIQYPLGIRSIEPGYKKVLIDPKFIPQLSRCSGHVDTARGRISVDWRQKDGKAEVKITLPGGVDGTFRGRALKPGAQEIRIQLTE